MNPYHYSELQRPLTTTTRTISMWIACIVLAVVLSPIALNAARVMFWQSTVLWLFAAVVIAARTPSPADKTRRHFATTAIPLIAVAIVVVLLWARHRWLVIWDLPVSDSALPLPPPYPDQFLVHFANLIATFTPSLTIQHRVGLALLSLAFQLTSAFAAFIVFRTISSVHRKAGPNIPC